MAVPTWSHSRAAFATLAVVAAASVALFVAALFGLVVYQNESARELAISSALLDEIADLGRMVGEVDEPANNAFDTTDRQAEHARLGESYAKFRAAFVVMRGRVANDVVLLAALDELDVLVAEMVVEGEAVFSDLARGDDTNAARHMAEMDRRFASARRAHRGLRFEVTKIARARDAKQSEVLRAGAIGTGVGGAVTVALIAVAVARGRRLARDEAAARESLARNQVAMKRILDAVGEGLILVDTQGRVSGARSAAFEKFFGPLPTGEKLWTVLDGPTGEWCELTWPTLFDGSVPRALALDQLPKEHRTNERSVSLSYQVSDDPQSERQVLVVARDTTLEEEARVASAEANDAMAALYVAVRDPFGMQDFLDEGRQILVSLGDEADESVEGLLALHTLKGNAGLFAIDGLARIAHDIESRVAEGETVSLAPLRERFDSVAKHVEPLLRNFTYEGARVSPAELTNLVSAASAEGVSTRILASLSALVHPRIATQLEGLAQRGRALAERLGIENVRFVVDAADLRAPHEALRPFLASLVHVVRNALDHAVEPAEARGAAGKRGDLTVTFRAFGTDGRLTIEIGDDGPGIDRSAIAAAAAVPVAEARPELVFERRLSTKTKVTDLSGRGVGLSAVKEACDAAGGRVTVRTSDEGVVLNFLFPAIRV